MGIGSSVKGDIHVRTVQLDIGTYMNVRLILQSSDDYIKMNRQAGYQG